MTMEESRYGFVVYVQDASLREFNNLMKDVSDQYAFLRLRNVQKLDVIALMKPLFQVDFPSTQNLAEWMIYHLEKVKLSHLQQTLLRDTVDYLKTGYRKIPLAMYRQMLTDDQVEREEFISRRISINATSRLQQQQANARLIHVIRELEREKSLFLRWVSTEDGLWDMVSFLTLITEEKEVVLN